jgi:hypothetical protein
MSSGEEVLHLYCNKCIRETRHSILASVKQSGSSSEFEELGIYGEYQHQILQCRGCEYVTYRTISWFAEAQHDDYHTVYEENRYPLPVSHQKPVWFNQLSGVLQSILDEMYTAIQHDLRYLAAVGARTALDIVIVDKIGDIGTFAEKIKNLEKSEFISNEEAELITAVVEAGNASAHRGYFPDKKHLISMIEILESLLHKFYVQDSDKKKLLSVARNIKKVVPPRPAKPPKGK